MFNKIKYLFLLLFLIQLVSCNSGPDLNVQVSKTGDNESLIITNNENEPMHNIQLTLNYSHGLTLHDVVLAPGEWISVDLNKFGYIKGSDKNNLNQLKVEAEIGKRKDKNQYKWNVFDAII